MARPCVYFHIDELARDAVVASALKRLLATRGIDLVYGGRRTAGGFDPNIFDLLIFPSLDLLEACFRDPTRIRRPAIILPTESIGALDSNVDRLALHLLGNASFNGKDLWLEKVSAFCLWGEAQKRIIDRFRPALSSRSHVIGHPRHDSICVDRGKSRPATQRIKVGYISRFDSLNPFDSRSNFDVIFHGQEINGDEYWLSPGKNIEDFFAKEVVDVRTLLALERAFDPQKFEFEIRIHPRENRKNWEKFIRRHGLKMTIAPWDQPFMHWLVSCDHVVGPPSTSFYDCLAAGIRPICTRDLDLRRAEFVIRGSDDENPILEYVLKPRSIEELLQLTGATRRHEFRVEGPLSATFRQETDFPDSRSSVHRLAEIVENCIASPAGSNPARTVRAALRRKAFVLKTQAAAAARGARMRWIRDVEQSSNFLLSYARNRWIDRLCP